MNYSNEIMKIAKEHLKTSSSYLDKIKDKNETRPTRMNKPKVTSNAHRVYKLYVQDLLEDILVDKYGAERGTKNWDYLISQPNGAMYKVGQEIQDEKAQMYLDLKEKLPTQDNYFNESYFSVWKRWKQSKAASIKTSASNWEYTENIAGNQGFITIEYFEKSYSSYPVDEFKRKLDKITNDCKAKCEKVAKNAKKYGKVTMYQDSIVSFNSSNMVVSTTINISDLKDEDVKNWDSLSEKLVLGK